MTKFFFLHYSAAKMEL